MSNIKNYSQVEGSYEKSKQLPGALSTDIDVMIIRTYVYSFGGKEGVPFITYLSNYVPKDFKEDCENDIYVNEHGAVYNAYGLAHLNDEQQNVVIEKIINEAEEEYPDYEFEMLPGSFPLCVDGGTDYSSGYSTYNNARMSTHVLYIKDYEKHLKNKKVRAR